MDTFQFYILISVPPAIGGNCNKICKVVKTNFGPDDLLPGQVPSQCKKIHLKLAIPSVTSAKRAFPTRVNPFSMNRPKNLLALFGIIEKKRQSTATGKIPMAAGRNSNNHHKMKKDARPMCRLLGVYGKVDYMTDLLMAFRELADHGRIPPVEGLLPGHKDGWGMARSKLLWWMCIRVPSGGTGTRRHLVPMCGSILPFTITCCARLRMPRNWRDSRWWC